MVRKDISTSWDRVSRNNMNDNFKELYEEVGNVAGMITDELKEEISERVIDATKLDWEEPVDSFSNLTGGTEGETRMVRDTGKVYRHDGADWKEIQQIDAGPVNEVDTRLTQQLAETDKLIGVKGSKIEPIESGAVVFVTDDGNTADYTHYKDIFSLAGVPCCTAIVTNSVERNKPSYTTKAQLLELQNDYDWEIMSHGHNHYDVEEMTPQEINDEYRNSKEWLDNNGFVTESMAIPYGKYTKESKEISKKYFNAVRSSNFGSKGYNEMPLDTYAMKTCWLDANVGSPDYEGFEIKTFGYYKNLIDQAMNKKKLLIISSHSENVSNTPDVLALFKQVVNYASEKANVMRFTDAYKLFSNPVDVGYGVDNEMKENRFGVGRDGSFETNYKVDAKEFNGKTHHVEFENMKTTVSVINSPDEKMPTTDRGVLFTHKYGVSEPDLFTFQEYKVTDGSDVSLWKRLLLRDATWESWKNVSSYRLGMRARTEYGFHPKTPLEDFPFGVTENMVQANSVGLVGAPFSSGVLITHHVDWSEMGYSFQVYHPYGQETIYKRSFKTGGTPRHWVAHDESQFRLLGKNSTTLSTPFDQFKLGITRNSLLDVDGLPEDMRYGTLTTHINLLEDYTFNWQVLEGRDGATYKRRFETSGLPGSWTQVIYG